jgi:hypothetical protein
VQSLAASSLNTRRRFVGGCEGLTFLCTRRPSAARDADVTPHKLEYPAGEEGAYATQARHRHSLRRARRTSGG